jgi:predicted  nucleic acid-binding Zn-ribbon protein
MTLIRRIPNSVVVNADPVPQTEGAGQTQPLKDVAFGIADTADQFETAPENSYYLEEKAQRTAEIQPPANRDVTVEASSLFSAYEPNVSLLDNRLPQLMDRLDSLTEIQNGIQSQIESAETEKLKAQQALDEVIKIMNSYLPITDELRALLEPIGLWVKIAELPTPAVFGMRLFANQKLKEVKDELERRIQEIANNIESLKSQLEEVESEMKSVSEQIKNEKERQAKEASPYQMREPISNTRTIVAEEQLWEGLYDQELIQNNETRMAVPFNEMATALNEDLFKKNE